MYALYEVENVVGKTCPLHPVKIPGPLRQDSEAEAGRAFIQLEILLTRKTKSVALVSFS